MSTNILLQKLINNSKLIPKGLPHYGGKQYSHWDNNNFIGNINTTHLGELIYDLTNEEILEIARIYSRKLKIEKLKKIIK